MNDLITDGYVIDLVRNAIFMVLIIAAPIMILGILTGLVIAIFQAVTSIQEQTLTFVPKLIVIFFALIYMSFFIINKIVVYTKDLMEVIPKIGGN